jgi:hypothetical protein
MKLSNRQTVKLFIAHCALCIVHFGSAAFAAEPIHWSVAGWDDTGAPKGALLTDNTGWWGERVWTGVTYEYEEGHKPGNPRDIVGDNAKVFGRRLLDGRVKGSWHVPVGWNTGSLAAVFDFKRPCVFNEVDLFMGFGQVRDHEAKLRFSGDGTNWHEVVTFSASNKFDRIRLDPPAKGRFMRLELSETGAFPYTLDEVLVWGEGEVSEKYPEDARPAVAEWKFPQSIGGNAKTRYSEAKFDEFAARSSNGVEIVALGPRPDNISWPILGRTPESLSLKMARNETEARYFAIVNATRETNNVAIAVEGVGGGVSAELLVGGTILTSQRKRKLSEQEKFDLKIKGEVPEEMFDTRYDALPFFGAESRPSEGVLSRYVANREQVRGFPSAVPLRPGEAVVVMLRLKTDGAEPGVRKGSLVATMSPSASSPLREGGGGEADGGSTPSRTEQARSTPPAAVGGSPLSEGADMASVTAGNRPTVKPSNRQTDAESTPQASIPLAVEVVDLTLPDPPVWIYAWGPFTSQFPFESETRFEQDAKAAADLGVTQWAIPSKGSKYELVMKMRPHCWFMSRISDGRLFDDIYCCRVKELTDAHRKHLDESAERALARAEKMGIKPERVVFDMPDEIGRGNAKVAGEMALHVKSKHPEVSIFCNPSFWGRGGFADATTMTNCLVPWYNEAIDISVPYRSHLEDKVKREEIFTKPRRVNAQYAHPAGRAGRSISWSSFRYGMDGYAWWAYYSPTGNPWDIRTWRMWGYEALNALPLENGVAVCPAYEEMREAWEDWRLLTALKEAGKTELLDSLLKEFGDSFDRPNMETARPYKCDFLKLRDKALGAFVR